MAVVVMAEMEGRKEIYEMSEKTYRIMSPGEREQWDKKNTFQANTVHV